MFLRSGFPFNYDTNGDGDASGLLCEDPSLAQQSAAQESDINTIVRRFHLTGQLPENLKVPVFQDFEGIFDYQSARNIIRAADEAFMRMPADVRSRFHNDGQEFVAFVSDDKNRAEAEKLGIVVKRPEPVLAPGVAVAPAAALVKTP